MNVFEPTPEELAFADQKFKEMKDYAEIVLKKIREGKADSLSGKIKPEMMKTFQEHAEKVFPVVFENMDSFSATMSFITMLMVGYPVLLEMVLLLVSNNTQRFNQAVAKQDMSPLPRDVDWNNLEKN